MKSCTSLQKYKKHQRSIYLQFIRNRFKRRKKYYKNTLEHGIQWNDEHEILIKAPETFCLIENPLECSVFFSRMRIDYRQKFHVKIILYLDCTEVKSLDFATIVLFKAVLRELKNKGILVKGTFPEDENCRKYLIEAGFLKDMYDSEGHRFVDPGKSIILKIEKGNGILTIHQSKAISALLGSASEYLWNKKIALIRLKSVLKEICGNSIEWGDAFNKFWMIGAKFDEKKVIFVAVDLGQGILNSLKRKFSTKIIDWLTKKDQQVLEGAFDRKYGSTSTEINRNNGLPSIKALSLDGQVENLSVVTNNVLLNFEDMNRSVTFAKKRNAFMGTLYTWEISANNLKN